MIGSDSQCIAVLADNDSYLALTDITHEVVFESTSAREVIQYAVGTQAGGGEVRIGKGTFPLDGPVELADKIWLHGSGRGTRLLVTGVGEDGIGLRGERLRGAEISNLALASCDNPDAMAGILLHGCGDCKVRDVLCVGFARYGIWVREHAFLCEVRGCSLAGNGKAGILFENQRRGEYGNFIPNLIANCIVYGGGKGIECDETTVLNIVACAVYQTGDVAYHIHDISCSVLISGCRSFQITGPAVLVERADEFNLSSNIFCWHTGDGVVVRDCGWGTICGNEIIDSGSYNPGTQDFTTRQDELPDGIPLQNGVTLSGVRGFSVSGNTIFNWPQARRMNHGIFEGEDCYQNVITGNAINYFAGMGVHSLGRDTVVSSNASEGDSPHGGNLHEDMIQSFQMALTKEFIDSMK